MTTAPRTIQPAIPAIASAILALALYAVTIPGTYIYDDVQIIGLDARIHSPALWKEIWTKDYFNGGIDNLYRPLVSQSYAIQWWMHGDKPWAFHLVNVVLHAAVAAAVAELARRLAGVRTAFAAGLLFAAHPVHVEVVAGIVGRAEEVCALFLVGAMILFLHRPLTVGRVAAIAACAVGALLSKEQGMLLPFLLLALALFTAWRPGSPREKQAGLLLLLALCWSTAGFIVLREQVLHLKFEWEPAFLDETIQPLARSGRLDHALMVFVLLGRYAALMIAPLRLSIDYGTSVLTSVVNRRDPYLYLGVAVAVAGAVALVRAIRRRQWAAAYCLTAAGLTYAMVSNVILIGAILGERLIYLPSAFLLIWAAVYLGRLRPAALGVVLAILLAAASARTVTYAARWTNRPRFYETSLKEQPRSVRLHELVAIELMARGDLAAAARVAADGRNVAPRYWNVWVLSGKIAEDQGDLDTAEAMYKKSFDLQPNFASKAALDRIKEKKSHR